MRNPLLGGLLLACIGSGNSLFAGVIPEGFPGNRYETLWKHSPFTIATAQTDAPVVAPGFETKLAVIGVATIGKENIVTLLDKDSQEHIIVGSRPDMNKQDIKLVSIDENRDPLKTVITVQKGNEVGKVKFDPSLIAAQAPAAPPPINPQNPVQPHPPGVSPLSVRRPLPVPSPIRVRPPASTGGNPVPAR